MRRLVLFSTPTKGNIDEILNLIFPGEIKNKVLAYMPSDGANCLEKYLKKWKKYAKKFGVEFKLIDNSKTNIESENERRKLLEANVLVITGGNTFTLLYNLQRSGLDKTIKEFVKKPRFVLSGFSAGAIVLTPTIGVAGIGEYDKNEVGLKDLTGIGIVDFEVFPHYSDQWSSLIEKYKKTIKNEVRKIAEEEFLVVEL